MNFVKSVSKSSPGSTKKYEIHLEQAYIVHTGDLPVNYESII